MDELETLLKQKREIEEKIRILKNQSEIYGRAKVDVEHYPTGKPDRHFLAIHYKPLDNGRPKWQAIFSSNSRKEVIETIPGIISNLQTLYKNLTGENNGR